MSKLIDKVRSVPDRIKNLGYMTMFGTTGAISMTSNTAFGHFGDGYFGPGSTTGVGYQLVRIGFGDHLSSEANALLWLAVGYGHELIEYFGICSGTYDPGDFLSWTAGPLIAYGLDIATKKTLTRETNPLLFKARDKIGFLKKIIKPRLQGQVISEQSVDQKAQDPHNSDQYQ